METLQGAGFQPVDSLLVWSAVVGIAVLEAKSAQLIATQTAEGKAKPKLRPAETSNEFPRVREIYALLEKRSAKTLAFDLLDEVVALLADPAPIRKKGR